jgi:Leucine-rich repeat (LRR) protein
MIVKNEIKSSQLSTCLLMKNLKITALYESNRLTHIQFLDLSHNLLIKLSKNFNDLVSLEVLIMDFNNIFTIDKEFKLNKLKTLSLNNNSEFFIFILIFKN